LRFPGPRQINPVQAAHWAAAVIEVENATGIAFAGCEITNIGEYAIEFKNTEFCWVIGCILTDLGAGGIKIGGSAGAISRYNVVTNNIIHRGGRLHASAVGIWLGNHTEDNVITHNDIGDFYYTAISAGWSWGYHGHALRNIITFNRLHNLGQGALADMAGVYLLGTSHGTRVANNVIFNVKTYSYGGWGLYPDEGCEGIIMENNLVYDTTDGSFHQHFGRNNTIRNNILAFSTPHQVAVTRVEPHLSMTFERNIIYWTEGTAIGYRADEAQIDYRSNLWFRVNEDGTPGEFDFRGKTFEEWQALGRDVDGIVADPLFVDAANRDFRLRENSPALAIGFVPFDYSRAGVYGDERLLQRVRDFVTPVHPHVPPVPPFRLVEGFETPRHSPLLNGSANDEGRNLIRLTKDNPASGEYCLEIVYEPGLERPWNPHLYYSPNYTEGRVRVAFSLRMEENAIVEMEMRDRSSPYRVGPRFRIERGRLVVQGGEFERLPVNEWIHFEIITHVGEQSTGTWNLRIISDGLNLDGLPLSEKEIVGLPFRHADWRALTWFGFSNQVRSTDRTTYFLDDIEIVNE